MVPVGNAGNAADTNGVGSVPYNYRIGEFDITASQYTAFLNAVAANDPYGLYSPDMGILAGGFNACGISQSGSPGSYTYATTKNGNFPVNYVSWGDAARFCNWLENGQPNGPEGDGTTETGSYTLDGATTTTALMAVTRNRGAVWAIPTENEWYKAAYYKGGGLNAGYWLYPTQSDTAPSNVLSATGTNNANFDIDGNSSDPTNVLTVVGAFASSPGPYGTFDQGGDLWEWNEADVTSSEREIRGGSFADPSTTLLSSEDGSAEPTVSFFNGVGFRVVELSPVPEPSTIILFGVGIAGLVVCTWRRRRLDRTATKT
jgi:formylglycine-generating enzyme required for sulfatase activity